MNAYIITLSFMGHRIAIRTTASSREAAIEQVCAFEGAPHSAVVQVQDLGAVAPAGDRQAQAMVNDIRKAQQAGDYAKTDRLATFYD